MPHDGVGANVYLLPQQRRSVTERFLRGLRVRVQVYQGPVVGGLDFNDRGRQLDLLPFFSHHLAQADRASRLGCAVIAKRSISGPDRVQIGRASCRERGEIAEGGGALKEEREVRNAWRCEMGGL